MGLFDFLSKSKDDKPKGAKEIARLERTVRRVEKIKEAIGSAEPDLATAALKFALKPDAVSTVIPGIRNINQAEANCGVSDQPAMGDELERALREHRWLRAFWYGGN